MGEWGLLSSEKGQKNRLLNDGFTMMDEAGFESGMNVLGNIPGTEAVGDPRSLMSVVTPGCRTRVFLSGPIDRKSGGLWVMVGITCWNRSFISHGRPSVPVGPIRREESFPR